MITQGIRLPSAAPYGFAGSVAGFQWWLLVSICIGNFPVLIFPNTRNRLTSLLTIAKQCWNARDLCQVATKKEAPNKKSNASIPLLSDYLSRPENWNQIPCSQVGYWEPKSHLLSTWKWPCAITVFISMNFSSGSLLSQQMVWWFITGDSLKTQSPSTLQWKISTETLSPMILQIPHFKILTSLFPPITDCCIVHDPYSIPIKLLHFERPSYIKSDLNSDLHFLLPDAAKLWEVMVSLTAVSNELCFVLSIGCVANV